VHRAPCTVDCYNASMDIAVKKKKLRESVRTRLNDLSAEEKKQASRKIFEAIRIVESYRKAKSVMLYASTETEVDTFPVMEDVLKRGLELWLPFCNTKTNVCLPVRVMNIQKDLSPGAYGILEPPQPAKAEIPQDFKPELIFVPGIAFDKKGHRLGRGLGYYDRFLSKLPKTVTRIGLAFDCQIEKEVPVDREDALVDQVISG